MAEVTFETAEGTRTREEEDDGRGLRELIVGTEGALVTEVLGRLELEDALAMVLTEERAVLRRGGGARELVELWATVAPSRPKTERTRENFILMAKAAIERVYRVSD